MKKNKKLTIIFIIVLIFLVLTNGIIGYIKASNPTIKNIEISNNLNEDNTKKVIVNIHNPLNKTITCYINTKKSKKSPLNKIKTTKNTCTFNVSAGSYYIILEYKDKTIYKKIEDIKINKILNLTFKTDKIYLTFGETYKLTPIVEKLGEVDETINYEIENESIIKIENNIITPLKLGTTKVTALTSNNIKKEFTVIVTNLYKKANLNNNNTFLTCNRYTNEENKILDDILSFKINEAGYQTRGAVVAAARFLMLEFPYRIPYFGENGRLSTGANRYADGEGRYYKKGLYLSPSKFSTITASLTGPAIWGCPLKQLNETPNPTDPNGLDCSGFVTWTLYNAGFDVGDIGAGFSSIKDVSDLGTRHQITRDYIKSGNYKVGDLIGWDGHAAIIAGLTNDKIYIAESLYNGAVIVSFNKNEQRFYNLYTYINTMENIYKEEGNYTNMW